MPLAQIGQETPAQEEGLCPRLRSAVPNNVFYLCLLLKDVCSVLWTTSGSGSSVVLLLPWGYYTLSIGVSLVFPVLHFVSFVILGFCAGGSSPSFIDRLGQGRPGANGEAPKNPSRRRTLPA